MRVCRVSEISLDLQLPMQRGVPAALSRGLGIRLGMWQAKTHMLIAYFGV